MKKLISRSLAAISQLIYKQILVAARMESHGIAGAIQVTKSTYDILQNKYLFEDRGIIHVKGKGDMNTYLLKGRLVSAVSA